jgi:hypothetical protein
MSLNVTKIAEIFDTAVADMLAYQNGQPMRYYYSGKVKAVRETLKAMGYELYTYPDGRFKAIEEVR